MTLNTLQTSFSGPELCALQAHEVVSLLKRGEVSKTEVLMSSIQRIEAVDSGVNALPTRCFDRALAALSEVSEGSLLAGLPLTIKDNIEVCGVKTTFGSTLYRDNISKVSDPCVRAVEAAGGVVVAKSNLPELSAGGMCSNPVFGTTHNPWDTRRTCGGSSGGGAAALASGQAWLSVGGDLAGSLRTPAALCGIVGMRPTPGLVAAAPPKVALDLKATNGPMARSVRDCALLLDAMVGNAYPEFEAKAQNPEGRLRIAFSPDLGGICSVDPIILHVITKSLAKLARDHEVAACDENFSGLNESYRILRGLFYVDAFGALPEEEQTAFNENIKDNISFGRSVTPQAQRGALSMREALKRQCDRLFESFDAIACPVVGIGAPFVETSYPVKTPRDDYLSWLSFSFLASLLELPAISIPVGFDATGMPVGMQLIGKVEGDADLIAAAARIEHGLGLSGGPIDFRS